MTASAVEAPQRERRLVFRHPLVIRVAHWVNVVALTILLFSGLQIFNAHPALYLGKASTFDNPLVELGSTGDPPTHGYLKAFGHRLDTTGVLGLSNVGGEPTARGFPSWITLPADQDLATGRRWHFLFAWIFVVNGLVYLGVRPGLRRDAAPPDPDRRRTAVDPRRPPRASDAAFPARRSGDALQRAAEAHLSRRRARAAAVANPRGAGDVAGHRTPSRPGCSICSAAARAPAPFISSSRRCWCCSCSCIWRWSC